MKIRNPKSASRNRRWASECFGHHYGPWCRRKEVVRERSAPGIKTKVSMEKLFAWPVRGARRGSGGARTPGRGMNGMLRLRLESRGQGSGVRGQKVQTFFIAFIASYLMVHGLLKGFMTDGK